MQYWSLDEGDVDIDLLSLVNDPLVRLHDILSRGRRLHLVGEVAR